MASHNSSENIERVQLYESFKSSIHFRRKREDYVHGKGESIIQNESLFET